MLKNEFERKDKKISKIEADNLYHKFEGQAHWHPLLEDARVKMASRDLCFRDALHLRLKEYLAPLAKDDFERFLGSSSIDVEKQLEEFHKVFKRLKERE